MSAFTIRLCLLVASITQSLAASVDLPGVDVLSAGYDAAAWIEKANSKYRIFDLSGVGREVEVQSLGKSFTAPEMVSVVTDGPQCKRVEASCENIATGFASYLRTHFESTSIDVGVDIGSWKLGLQYHKVVQEIYEAITMRGQAIGISESWWGMYQVSLPPPFLLAHALDPMFAAAKMALYQLGAPKTDSEQEIYNQVCCGPASFGTHYIGSVIVGARASVTTFVNSSFHTQYSEKDVSEQISIGFEWNKLKAMGSHTASDVEKRLMQAYKNNSYSHLEWQPDSPEIHSSTSPWLAWQDEAVKNPSVINFSASSLAHLFYDRPDVMNHMQKTIDFYVSKGEVPALKDLGAAGRLAHNPSPAPWAPGLDVVGCGFHAPTLTSRMCLFDISEVGSTWANPYYRNISYRVPSGFFAADMPESVLLNGTVLMQTVDDYVEHSLWTEHHHSDGFLGFGSKSEDKTMEEYYRNFYAHNYFLALSMRQVSWFTLQMFEFPLPAFSKNFQTAVDFLPRTYDPSNATAIEMFAQFFEAVGTSVVSKATMGGLVWAESWYESCLSRLYSDKCITDEVTRGWVIFEKHDTSHTCDQHITQDFSSFSSRHFEVLGGTAKVNLSDWEAWAVSVKNDPRPVSLDMLPIFFLLPDSSPVKHALEMATTAFLRSAASAQQCTIDALEEVRAPPASVCNRTKISGSNTLPPEKALCPFVGYHGAYCPTSVSETSISLDDPPNLPRGVGLTIDISNGDLKLPAWDFDFSDVSHTWTDPSSKQVFRAPRGVELLATTAENVPVVSIFKTEAELASVWEEAYTRGSWFGGEFGNSKSVSQLYEKFFSKQQVTSINQHPTALYRLRLEDGWQAHLNAFAVSALQALPQVYDASIYCRFLDTWGTHVASDTLVGGMAEQQITMKDCVFQSPHLSGGLSEIQLQKYLTMDLSREQPQDVFYTSRSQMNLDHKIGGNPELTDQLAWSASLAKDPALLKIYSYDHWAEVASRANVVTATVAANLRRAIDTRLASASQQRSAEKAAMAQRRLDELQGPRPVVAVVGHGRRGSIAPQVEVGISLTLRSFAECPTGLDDATSTSRCTTGVNIHSWNTHELITPLRYERNAEGGVRSIRCFDLDNVGKCIDHAGPWVAKGCSLQPMADGAPRDLHQPVPSSTVVGAVCADCELIAASFAYDATLQCACPGFALGADSCYDTYSGSMPNLKQCDPRWKCFPFRGDSNWSTCNVRACVDGGPAFQTNNICGSGCGITSSAMVLSYYGRHASPPDVAEYLLSEGYRNDLGNTSGATCDGISHAAIRAAASHWGLSCMESNSFDSLDEWLERGPVIAHVRHRPWTKPTSCKFTKGGHYIVIVGKRSAVGEYDVSDPNSCEDENMHGTVSDLSRDCYLVGFVRIFGNQSEIFVV